MKYRQLLLILIAAFTAITVQAQQVTFEVQTPSLVAAGERFRVEFTLTNAQSDNFTPPTFTGLSVLAGPTTSTGSMISMINGVQNSQTTLTYTYLVQSSTSEKRAIISPAVITAGGKTYTTKTQLIDIAPGGEAGTNSSASRNQPSANGSQTLAADDILLKMEINRSNVYKGEAIVASLKIYARVGIAGLENAKYPAFNGFWTQELEVANQRPERQTVGGKVYESQIIRQWLIYPQKTGVIEIEQSSFTAIAQIVTQSAGNSMFDSFFGGGSSVQHVNRPVSAPAVRITVKDLPSPVPANFSGAVGQFKLESSLTSPSFTANSGGSIILKLSGKGDFPLIQTPKIELPAAFELYDTKTSEQITNSTAGTTGTRTWEYPFIARAEGNYTIDPIEISYFDPATGRYAVLRSQPFEIEILKDNNSGGSVGAIVSGVTKEDLKMLGQDIRFIRVGEPKFKAKGDFVIWSLTFFIAVILMLVAFGATLFFLKKQIGQRADLVRVKNKKANSVALKRLKKAKGYMVANDEVRFFEEILRALWGYMGDKLAIDVAELTKERVRHTLLDRGVSPEQSEEFLTLVSECELAQYSPISGVKMDKAYNAALDLIGRFQTIVNTK